MHLNSPEIKSKIATWQQELREITHNQTLCLQAYQEPKGYRKIEEIIDAVCDETGVDKEVMPLKTRKREAVVARQLIAYYGKMCTQFSLKEIGYIIGGRDHTTAIHSINTIKDMLDTRDPVICGLVSRLNVRLELNNQP